jgi:hypothetical protein
MTGIKYELIACSARITRTIAQKTWAASQISEARRYGTTTSPNSQNGWINAKNKTV